MNVPIPGLAARRAATSLVHGVLQRGRPLDEALDDPKGPLAALDARDRALSRAIAGASLRRLGSLRGAIKKFLRKPLDPRGALESILLTGAAQILLMDVPDHTAVDLAVEQTNHDRAAKPFAPLVNAVLRNIARERESLGEFLDDPSRDVPQWLDDRRIKAWGPETAKAIAAAERAEPALDITAKSDAIEWAQKLNAEILPTGTIRLLPDGPVPELPGFNDGAWWVQDAAAALPAKLVKAKAGQRVADLCAAPGGKTAQLAASGADVVAVDRSAPRLRRLTENLKRLGLSAQTVTADATQFKAEPFDAVLLDAPCSATGTIRRHPDVAWLKGPEDIEKLAALQARLLDAAADLVKPGGVLVYSTCSLEPEEGEGQIAALLKRRPDLERDPVSVEELGGQTEFLTALGEVRTLPCHLARGEPRLSGLDGFYAARLRRRP
ncbi:MFS transporter [Terrihabitans soli]|uniref:MFS transporter n=1 Tax=Terrihabitans soli TaxID=708113 RepID=A0A6S6QH88_9HYPH|nr:transcription antitermination factor NusB [Terrihabitans soli]BCJ89504.1 MFS transporter [Terrihabitans soli]